LKLAFLLLVYYALNVFFYFVSYNTAYGLAEFSLSLKLRRQMYLQARVDSIDKRLTVMAEKCFATLTPNENDAKKAHHIG